MAVNESGAGTDVGEHAQSTTTSPAVRHADAKMHAPPPAATHITPYFCCASDIQRRRRHLTFKQYVGLLKYSVYKKFCEFI